ncbi:chitobiase/beta-hexosaminidase C-terminal domain-containing protein [Leptospira sp. 201903070]|uniref:Chitobiase/beta-hexosaminidase C-terminal domain-containing protein n=1 Tax=Leptospira ainlahdjerensis TaxID=2810033 RepID=A0ABS2UE58_9LEPT|nr:chitobiase/beta-hexosaminidase C-terminal domain-containing protein [Leptospira ainlahdjerensis]MBM9578454.1 chitobiase/beta-hexosaminidase C-terminal domain-containing protein [Leptospira ainlahdjerensis]
MIIDMEGNARIKGTFLDVNGDGIADGIDTNKNNVIDMLVSDTDQDGVLDSIDTDGDGATNHYLCLQMSHYSSRTGKDCTGNPLAFIDLGNDGIADGFDVDNDGTINDPILKRIQEDLDSPSISISSNNLPGTYGNAQKVKLTCTDNIGPGSIAYTLDGSVPNFSPFHGIYSNAPSVNFNVGSDSSSGDYRIKYLCRDLAGNLSPIQEALYRIDTTLPVIVTNSTSNFISIQTGAIDRSDITWSSNVSVAFTIRSGASDCGSGLEVTRGFISSGTNSLFSVTAGGNFSGEGTKQFTIFGYVDLNGDGICTPGFDRIGSSSISIQRDDTSPSVSVSPDEGNFGTITNVSLTCSDSGSGCDQTVVNSLVNGTPANPTINAFSGTVGTGSMYSGTAISTVDNATTSIKFIARDKAGNVSSVTQKRYTIDLATPNITINSNIRYVSGENGSIAWQSDRTGSYQIILGGSSCTTGTILTSGSVSAGGPDTVTAIDNARLSVGDNRIRICVASAINVGNTTITITKDQSAPTVSITSPTSIGPFPIGTSFNTSCTDVGSAGCDKILYTLDGTSPSFNASGGIANGNLYSGSVSLSAAGQFQIKVIGIDKAGNISSIASQTVNIGPPPSPKGVLVGAGNAKLVVSFIPVTGATSYKVYTANSGGVTTSMSSVSGTYSPITLSGLTNGTAKFIAVTAIHNGGESSLSVERSGVPTTSVPGETALVHKDISGAVGQGTDSGKFPSAAIDPINKKLLVVTQNGSNGDKPSLYRCDLNGNSCQHFDISFGQGNNSGKNPSIAVDEIGGKILVATENGANSSKPSLFRCDLDGSNCGHLDISAGQGSGSGTNPKILIDQLNRKLLVVTNNTANGIRPSLFQCDMDGTNCIHRDISAGEGVQSGFAPIADLDYTNRKILVITRNQGNSDKPSLFRCDLDGTNCAHIDYSAGRSFFAQIIPAMAVDQIAGKVLMTTFGLTNNTSQIAFFRSDLDGTSNVQSIVTNVNSPSTPGNVYLSMNLDFVNSKLILVYPGNGSQNQVIRTSLSGTSPVYNINQSGDQGFNSGHQPFGLVDFVNGKYLILNYNVSHSGKLSLFIR